MGPLVQIALTLLLSKAKNFLKYDLGNINGICLANPMISSLLTNFSNNQNNTDLDIIRWSIQIKLTILFVKGGRRA